MKMIRTAISLALALSAAAAMAQDVPNNIIRGGIAYHDPTGEETIEDTEGENLNLDWDSATGYFVAYERRFTKLLGLELMATRSEPDWRAELGGDTVTSGATFTAVTAGLNIHFFGRGAIDLYAAPLIGYAFFDADDVDLNDDFLYGAAVGIDIGLGDGGFALTGSARYMKTKAETEGEFDGDDVEISFDPFILTLGVAYRF